MKMENKRATTQDVYGRPVLHGTENFRRCHEPAFGLYRPFLGMPDARWPWSGRVAGAFAGADGRSGIALDAGDVTGVESQICADVAGSQVDADAVDY